MHMCKAQDLCARACHMCGIADLAVVVRSEQDVNWETKETGDYLTTNCSSDMKSSRGSNGSGITTPLARLRQPAIMQSS